VIELYQKLKYIKRMINNQLGSYSERNPSLTYDIMHDDDSWHWSISLEVTLHDKSLIKTRKEFRDKLLEVTLLIKDTFVEDFSDKHLGLYVTYTNEDIK